MHRTCQSAKQKTAMYKMYLHSCLRDMAKGLQGQTYGWYVRVNTAVFIHTTDTEVMYDMS